VTGRATELIVLGGGKHFFPEDVERRYAASPFVDEIAVLEQSGSLVALVLPNYAAIHAAGRPAVEDALRVALAEIGRDLPPYQRLGGFAIARAPLPRTRLGKYRRFLLSDLYRQARTGEFTASPENLSAEDSEFLAGPRVREIWEWLKQRYPDRRLRLDSNPLLDLGIDSLERLSLALELEARFHIHLSEADLIEPQTLRELVDAVAAAVAAPPEGRPSRPPSLSSPPRPCGWAAALIATLAYAFNWALMRVVFRLRVVGDENLPPPGTYIIVANHVSYLDAPALAAALPYRHMRRAFWGGDATLLFTIPLSGWLWRALNVVPVDERLPGESLRGIGAMLEAGYDLMWFPEGWRSPTGELQHFQPGIGKIVAESGRIVVPALIAGTFEALPRGRVLPRPHRITVRVGNPFHIAQNPGGEAEFSRIAQILHDKVAALLPGIDRDRFRYEDRFSVVSL
jgi:long-chain acyl-CoA synthetase